MVRVLKKAKGYYVAAGGYDFNSRIPEVERGPFNSEPIIVEKFKITRDNSPYGEYVHTYTHLLTDEDVYTETIMYNSFPPYTAEAYYSRFIDADEFYKAKEETVLEEKIIDR